jgi:hypothetical protein
VVLLKYVVAVETVVFLSIVSIECVGIAFKILIVVKHSLINGSPKKKMKGGTQNGHKSLSLVALQHAPHVTF